MASVQKGGKDEVPDSESAYFKAQRGWERKEKGYKGQLGLKDARIRELEARLSLPKSEEGQSEPETPHGEKEFVRAYERYCPGCGSENPAYVKPNVFCNASKGGCGVPLGTVKDPAEVAKLQKCWNCGGQEAEIREPAKVEVTA